jgi:hypothetical protein
MLPEGLKLELLSPIECYKVEVFYQRFVVERYREYGDGHFLLACYAALPVVLTPDLLHRLWFNFSTYEYREQVLEIHRIAVADLLLSSLFEEISYETYEMPQAIRNVLMEYWQHAARGENTTKVPQVEKVAAFLLQYIKVYRNENHKIDQAFRDAQEWMALSYLQPKKAEKMMQTAMKNAVKDMNATPEDSMKAAEMMRLVEISRRAGERYNLQLLAPNQKSPDSFHQLAQSAEQLKKMVMGQVENISIAELSTFMSDTADSNAVTMEVPQKVMAKMPSEKKEEKPTLFAVFIGDFKADATQNSIIVFDQNVRTEIKELNGFDAIKVRVVQLRDEIHGILNSLFEETKPQDSVFIYEQANTTSPAPLDKVLYDFYNDKSNTLPYTTAFINVTNEFEKLPSEKIIFVSGIYLNGAAGVYFFGVNAQSKGRLPLQKLVALFSQNNQNQLRQYSNSPLIVNVTPRIYATPSAAKRPFLAVKNEVLEIQYLLRSLGVYEASANGIFNKATDDALKDFFNQKNQSLPNAQTEIITYLAQAEKEKEISDRPLYIFVFANPEQKLPYTIQERAALEGILRDIIEANRAEAFFLHDPDKQEIMEYFTKPEYRNRMQLFHFSGFDANITQDNGEHVLYLKENQEIQFDDLNQWLDFQENIQFIFLNSCRLRNFGNNLTLRGVGAVIAAEGVVMDDYAFNFAKEFYDELQEGKSLAEAFAEANKENGQQYYSNTNAHRAIQQEQSQSYGEPEPPQNNFELLYNWVKKTQTSSWRMKIEGRGTPHRNDETPTNHLLVISINDYPNEPLRNIRAFMPSLVSTLEKRYFFQEDHIIELYDESATNRAILETFSQLSKTLKATDKLCVIYSGKSTIKEDEVFWMPYDATQEDDFLFISYTQIKQNLATFECQNIVLIADTPCPTLFKTPLITKGTAAQQKDYWVLLSGEANNSSMQTNPFFEQVLNQLEHTEESLDVEALKENIHDVKAIWSGAIEPTTQRPFKFDLRPKFPYRNVFNWLQSNELDEAIQAINAYFAIVKNFELAAFEDYEDIIAPLISQTRDPFSTTGQDNIRTEVKNRLLTFIDVFYGNKKQRIAKKK